MKRLLKNLIVFYVDCQATGSDPITGHLLEIGWARSDRFSSDQECGRSHEVHFVKAPDDFKIPARVARVTGIEDDDVQNGLTEAEIWKKLRKTACQVARANDSKKCLTVIHFARFETAYLKTLFAEHDRDSVFPLEIICTHEIARRLFPELPRRGIKALAGFFGYSSSEKHRCQDHLTATVYIWQNMLSILARDYSITTYAQLKKWLQKMPVRSFVSRSYPMKDQYRRHLPDGPGVYRMCRSNNDVLYVGKASSLKKRVNSYFKKRGHHPDHILDMLTQARKIRIIETGSALEAALLESDLIKKNNPPYNVALRARQREIMFCNSTYTEFSSKPSPAFHVGPLTSKDPFYRLALLKPLLSTVGSRINKSIVQETLSLSESSYPGFDEIEEGIELFIERHQTVLCAEPTDHALVRLGQYLWRCQDDEVDPEQEDDAEVISEGQWSPEVVARSIENIVLRSMHSIRRTRLCILLAESSIAWEEPHGDHSQYMYLTLEKGVVIERGKLPRKKRPVIPPGYKRTFFERQSAFTLETVDRIRVLITELRRIVNSGLWLQVRLRPKVTLDNEKFLKIFTWI